MAAVEERVRALMHTPGTPKNEPHTPRSAFGGKIRDWAGPMGMEDPDGVMASVAQSIEQLRTAASTPQQREHFSKELYVLINTREEARAAAGSHTQAIPLLVSLLRSGTVTAKINAAATLGVLCNDEDLRVKVLLGGCIPPLISLLRLSSLEAQTSAAKTLYAVTQGCIKDHVGSRIFSTERVVPSLWEQLQPGHKLHPSVCGLVIGALRNLCNRTDGFWPAMLDKGGIQILVDLLHTGDAVILANACFLLANLMTAMESSSLDVLKSGAVTSLLRLLSPGNDVSVRAEAAGALRSLSSVLAESRTIILNAGGIAKLIGATVAPSKEFMQGAYAKSLQENAMGALANISGGLPSVIQSLGEAISSSRSDSQVADTIGALAYALMVLDSMEASSELVKSTVIENTLVKQLVTTKSELVHERAIEALASLYGNAFLASGLEHAEGKKMLVGLITMASPEIQGEFIRSLMNLCSGKADLWHSVRGREGIQLLISLLGLSSEQQQEYAVALISILTQSIDESRWAVTAAGGIPPLVQLLETGSVKAKEDSAIVLGNLCNHSEDIRACVETADAVPALLWLLKNASPKGQEIASRTLTQLVRQSDSTTISQLTAMLTGDLPESKMHVLDVLGCLLSVSSQDDIVKEGTAANESLKTVISLLSSSNEDTQGRAASVLASIFDLRKDLHQTKLAADTTESLIRLVKAGVESTATQAAEALAALFRCIEENNHIAVVARDALFPLIELAKSSNPVSVETAVKALANLLSDREIAEESPGEDIILPLTQVLHDGTLNGKERAACALARLLRSRPIDQALADSLNQCGTVLGLVALLTSSDSEEGATSDALEALASIARAKRAGSNNHPPWAILGEVPSHLSPIVACLAVTVPRLREMAVVILSRLCRDQPIVLGNLIANTPRCVVSLADRIISSSSSEVKVGATALLICATKEHRQKAVDALQEAGCCTQLIKSLVEMLVLKIESDKDEAFDGKGPQKEELESEKDSGDYDPTAALGGTVALWLLAVLASHDSQMKLSIMEAGAIDVLTEKLANFAPNARQAEVEDNGSTWVSALLLAILFQDRDVTRSPATMRAVPLLAIMLKSEEAIDRYFAAQALAGLVCNGSRGTLLAVANSGAVGGLIPILGCVESDIANLIALSEEFSLVRNPDQVALERLFRVDDIRVGATARKAIPALVELLKPIPERPGAPPLALGLLTQLAKDNNTNKLAMAEAGALDALTKYLSLGPQDAIEEATAELLRILFSSTELRRHESAVGAVDQLVAVLRLGTRAARYTAARALEGLFSAVNIKRGEAAAQAIQPLVDMLNSGVERDQLAAIGALIMLASENPPKALAIADTEESALEGLCRVLSSDCSLELKEDAAELCRILFGNSRIRASSAATSCIQPLVSLLGTAPYASARALDNLLDDEQQAEVVAAYGAVVPLVGMLVGTNYGMHEAAVSALIKLGKDRPLCKLDMVKAGVIDNILENLNLAPDSLCALNAELLRILTNNSSIAKGSAAAKVVAPLFALLTRPELGSAGQHSAMQVLVNILEKPQHISNQMLSANEVMEPLVVLLESPSQPVQQLAAELFSLLLAEEVFQRDISAQQSVFPLVKLVGVGIQSLQQKAIKALECASNSWPNAVADAGGVGVLSRVILQVDPPPPHAVWESAAFALANVLHFSAQYTQEIPVAVLVKLLRSSSESTVAASLSALLVLEREDSSVSESMAEAGAVEALLELLRCHQCEESAAQLLESLFNNVKVREMKETRMAISPLAQYLLDPQTRAQPAKLLAALALGDMFQNEALARTSDAVSACRALVSLLEDQPTEEMKMVAVCALQNIVVQSRANKRAVAEAGGIQVIQELLSSSNGETAGQAAALLKLLFSSHAIQEFASSELIQILAGILERDLWATASVNEDIIKSITVLYSSFPRLRGTEAATLSIQQLIGALKAGSEVAQEAALDALFLLRQAWPSNPAEVGKAQATAMADAISALQLLMRSGPQKLHEKIESLLQCLPGSLIVTIAKGNNLKQSMGTTNAFCKLTLGNGPPRQTKVVPHSTSPEWKQEFAWAFDMPPKGQKLHVSCKSKNAFGKGSIGKVTIQIDRVVMLGTISGEYQLKPDANRDGTPRTLEIEIQWTSR